MTFFSSLGSRGNSSSRSSSCQPLEIGLGLARLDAHRLAVVTRRVAQHLARGLEVFLAAAVLAVARDDRAEVLVPFRGAPKPIGIGEHCRVGQLGFDCGELVLESGEAFEHDARLRGDRDDLCGVDQSIDHPLRHRMHIPRRQGEHQARVAVDREPSVGRKRHEVEIDADGAHHDEHIAVVVSTRRDSRSGRVAVVRGDGRRSTDELDRTDEPRFGDEPMPKQPRGRDAVQRVRWGTDLAMRCARSR